LKDGTSKPIKNIVVVEGGNPGKWPIIFSMNIQFVMTFFTITKTLFACFCQFNLFKILTAGMKEKKIERGSNEH